MDPRGMFVVFEGIDRVGKSTQRRLVTEKLNREGFPAKDIAFPDRECPSTGAIIDRFLGKRCPPEETPTLIELAELFIENRSKKQDFIRDALGDGTCVICDRYAVSGAVYGADGVAVTVDDLLALESAEGRNHVAPDLTFFLTTDNFDELQSRADFGREFHETVVRQRAIHERYLAFMASRAREGDETYVTINAAQSPEAITEQIINHILARIPSLGATPGVFSVGRRERVEGGGGERVRERDELDGVETGESARESAARDSTRVETGESARESEARDPMMNRGGETVVSLTKKRKSRHQLPKDMIVVKKKKAPPKDAREDGP